jgi:HEAT repeat protein
MNRQLPAIAIALLIAIVCVYTLQNNGEDTPTQTPEATNPSTGNEATASQGTSKRETIYISGGENMAGERIALKAGQSHRFEVRSDQTVKMGGEGGPGDIKVAIEGTWEILVVDTNESETHLKALFEKIRLAVTVQGENALGRAQANSILSTLKKPTYFTLDYKGRVVATHHETGGDEKGMEILNGLISSIQLVRSDARQGTWIAEESDPTGDYLARYQREGNTIAKTKTRYVRVTDALGADVEGIEPPTVLNSTGEIQISKGWINTLKTHETIQPNLQDFGLDIQIESKTSLRRISSAFDASRIETDLAWMDGRITGQLHIPEDPKKTQDAVDTQLLKNHSNADIINELKRYTGEEANNTEVFRNMQRISAAVRRDPSSANLFLDSALESENRRMISATLGGLSEAGNPESQQALAGLLSDGEASTQYRESAAINMGMATNPTPETAAALSEHLNDPNSDVAGTSELALGNVAKNLMESDRETAGDVIEELVQRYFETTDLAERKNTLLALGNTGDSRILPCIDDALGSDITEMRATGASALRFVTDPTRNATLAVIMTHDVEPAVRIAAIQTSQYQSLVPLTDPLTAAIQADPESKVRLAAIIVVGQAMEQSPVFVDLVNWSADNDTHPDVIARAQSLLGDAKEI